MGSGCSNGPNSRCLTASSSPVPRWRSPSWNRHPRAAMDHDDHVRLIRGGVEGAGSTWADLGSGTGAFTLALADLLGPSGIIHSVDRDAAALRTQAEAVHRRFPATTLEQHVGDFTRP